MRVLRSVRNYLKDWRNWPILLFSLFIAISCESSDELILHAPLLHTDIQPDTFVSVIDSLDYNELYAGESCISHVYASPENQYEFDLNNDGIKDYRISHDIGKSYNMTWSPHNPCDTLFGFKIFIESLNGRNTILVDTSRYILYPGYAAEEMDTAAVVNSEAPSATNAFLYFSWPYIHSFTPDNPDMIVGLILSDGYGMYYGWLSVTVRSSGFTVKEFAVNLTPGKEIYPGQKANND